MNELGQDSGEFRLLILAPNWLGDAVMATGLLEYLDTHRRLPSGRTLHLTWAVPSAWAPLFRDDPRIDQVLDIDRPGRHGGLGGIPRLAARLREGSFAAALICPPSLRAGLVAALAGIPQRVGYRSDGRQWLLTVVLPQQTRGRQHFQQEMIALGRAFFAASGVPTDNHDLPAGTSLPGVSSNPEAPGRRVQRLALAPGATYGLAKTWPLEPARDFCRLCLAAGAELLLLGDGASSGFAADLAGALDIPVRHEVTGQAGLVDLTGRTDLLQVTRLLTTVDGYVGNDSGLMHVAAALGVPTLGIFGSSNPDWTRPLGPCSQALVAQGFSCHPCYLKTCNQPEFCLDTVSGLQAYTSLQKLMPQAEGTQP